MHSRKMVLTVVLLEESHSYLATTGGDRHLHHWSTPCLIKYAKSGDGDHDDDNKNDGK